MKKILIANRGEIAVRIIRSAREMGIKTVAVYSDADVDSVHVKMADESYRLGPAVSSESYLRMDKILDAVKVSGADAVHPGFGFLSENADFAREVQQQGITFIGPSPASIALMGDKLSAKKIALEHNIPLVPGTNEPVGDIKSAVNEAKKIGFPILIKASAGGGGKGMRIVYEEDAFTEQLELAMSEALKAFGDGSVFIERFIQNPRHIEFQVMADNFGNTVHLFERECSIQRRYQKVVEETPSMLLDESMRKKMGDCAVKITKACNYSGAGTVEFVVDENKNFYFLEMNTRLQVEHPVTELITNIDLVKEQIRVARNEKLRYTQADIQQRGHAIQLRMYAEDPKNNFLPDTGKVIRYRPPQGVGVRVDDAFEEGAEIPIYYDPMIGKLIVYGENREEAMQRMIRAIDEFQIVGVSTTLNFGKFVMKHPAFRSGDYDTNFVKNHFSPDLLDETADEKLQSVLSIASVELHKKQIQKNNLTTNPDSFSDWYLNRKC